jgi:CRISPR system Cascade subunit CasD
MAVLLLRLSGPMQAWGGINRFGERLTDREPSKSGVIGLLCAALGKPREEVPGDGFPTLAELGALRMGVRVDSEGIVLRDYQTAGGGTWPGRDGYGVRKADGKAGDTVLSRRFYLADADFLAGLEGELALLKRLERALLDPVWPLALGRKAFLPGLPIWFRGCLVENKDLEEALRFEAWSSSRESDPSRTYRMVLECVPTEEGMPRQDQPLDFRIGHRAHGVRRVRELRVEAPQEARK